MTDFIESNGFTLNPIEPDLLPDVLVDAFSNVYSEDFANALMGVNHHLKTEVRGWQIKPHWAQAGLLTPWMLAIVYMPLDQQAFDGLICPDDWATPLPADRPYQVIGPLMTLQIGDKAYPAHLNFHSQLGHYWLRPLVQNMARYSNNDQAFDAWAEVLAFRKAIREQKQAQAAAQAEQDQTAPDGAENQDAKVSRRAMLAKWLTPKA
jgi:hypothetical protein